MYPRLSLHVRVSAARDGPQPSVLLWGSHECWREEATRIGRSVFFLLFLVKGGGGVSG